MFSDFKAGIKNFIKLFYTNNNSLTPLFKIKN